MFRILLVVMIIVPALEIWVLISAGKWIGALPTISLIFLTGILGAWLAKYQGISALRSAQQKINSGQMPGEVIIDGICILIGGVLLLVPGFITDVIGLALLLPLVRNLVKPFIIRGLRNRMDRSQVIVINKR